MSKGALKGEAAVKRAVTDLLDAERIPWWRMNAGGTLVQSKGKTYRIAGAQAGTADILAAPICKFGCCKPKFLWIECKRPKGGVQSDAQKEFQRFIVEQGHEYMIATSSDDVLDKLRRMVCE